MVTFSSVAQMLSRPGANAQHPIAQKILHNAAWTEAIGYSLSMEETFGRDMLPRFGPPRERVLMLDSFYSGLQPDPRSLREAQASTRTFPGGYSVFSDGVKTPLLLQIVGNDDPVLATDLIREYGVTGVDFKPADAAHILETLEARGPFAGLYHDIGMIQSDLSLNTIYRMIGKWSQMNPPLIDSSKVSELAQTLPNTLADLRLGDAAQFALRFESYILEEIGTDALRGYISNRQKILGMQTWVAQSPKEYFEEGAKAFFASEGIPVKDGQVVAATSSSSYTDMIAIASMIDLHKMQHPRAVRDPQHNIVLVVEPYWEPLALQPLSQGAEVIVLPTADNDFKLSPDVLRGAIEKYGMERIAGMIIAAPNNSSMSVYSPQEMQALADVITEYKLRTVCDELYSGMERPEHNHTPLASLRGANGLSAHNFVFTNNGSSKTMNLQEPKFAFGTSGDSQWMSTIRTLDRMHAEPETFAVREQMLFAAHFLQHLPEAYLERNREAFAFRADQIHSNLAGNADLNMYRHDAGYMNCLTISRGVCEQYGITSSQQLFEYLAVTARVLTQPVSIEPDGCIVVRFNFFDDAPIVNQALQRIDRLVQKMQQGVDTIPDYATLHQGLETAMQTNPHVASQWGMKEAMGL